MTAFTFGVFLWGIRDLASGIKLANEKETVMKQIPELNQKQQHILVSGGSGFIGTPLCQMLTDQGHHVTIVTRSIEKAAAKFSGRISFIDSIDSLTANDAFDIIINLTGEPVAQRWNAASKSRIIGSRIDTINALTGFMQCARTKPHTFIQSSAIGIYGLDNEKAFEEATPLNHRPESYCEEICMQLEEAVKPIETLGIRVCLLRIGLVLEKDGGMLAQLLFPYEFGLGGKVGHGRQWMSWIHRDDVIGLIYHVINHDELSGAINATAPEPIPQQRFAKVMGKVMRRPTLLVMPKFQVKLLFGRMGEELLLAGQKVLPTRALESGYQFAYPELSNALASILKKHQ